MAFIMTNKQFVEKALNIANNYSTAYLWGTFGQPLTNELIEAKAKQYPAHYSEKRQKYLKSIVPLGIWCFDCVGLIKSICWGWNGDTSKKYGGAVYASNGVPDTNVTGLKTLCNNISTDFTNIKSGELVFMPGHIGIYEGNGYCVEATLGNNLDGVVRTKLEGRGWKEHGEFKFIEYIEEDEVDNLYIHVDKVGLYMRDALPKKVGNRIIKGNTVGFCKIGSEMKLVKFVPGIQCDGYQWVKVKAKNYKGNEVEAYAQYDSACYYIYSKEK